ncbi:prefoldin subunit alpha [Candidatus Woesearchaeota archaeon]|nr:prefoldin subunit alpha [Candidatus Woesearchaeota archaeon]
MAKKKANEESTEKYGKEKADESKSMQEKYFQLQMIEQQSKQLQQYLQVFDQQLAEIRNIVSALNELSGLKKGDTLLAPISNGIFVHAKLEDNKEVRVNVGAGTVVTKPIPDAIKMLESQESEIAQYRSDTMAKLEELMKHAEELQA